MSSSPVIQPSAFEQALDEFRKTLTREDQSQMQFTTLEDLQRCVLDIQREQSKRGDGRNLNRLKRFLNAMEQYERVLEVFLNASDILCFVWGPVKFLLQVTRNYIAAFDKLLDIYMEVGEILPLLWDYLSIFQDKKFTHMHEVLKVIFLDILHFHQKAYKFFKKSFWKQLFHEIWNTLHTEFRHIRDDLLRHKSLVESRANIVQFEEIRAIRARMDEEFAQQRKVNQFNQRNAIRHWLNGARVEEDYETRSSARDKYPGVCRWILKERKFELWMDSNSAASPFLWITGIPGAGKSTLASFIIETLRSVSSSSVLFFFCKTGDNDRDTFLALARSLIQQTIIQGGSEYVLQYVLGESAQGLENTLTTTKDAEKILDICIKDLSSPYVIIDGLDECKPGEKSRIVSWFTGLAGRLKDDGHEFRCLFSSQRDEETSKLYRGVPVINIEVEGLAFDIKTFCIAECEHLKAKFRLNGSEADHIAQKVSKDANSMFLYAKLMMHHLYCQTSLSDLRRELEPNRFPKDIDQLYDRIVDRIFNPKAVHRKDVLMLLSFLLCAKRTIKWYEIQGVKSLDLDSRDCKFDERSFRVDAKDLCGSLVEVRPNDTVELVHATAKAYLLDKSYFDIHKEEFKFSAICLKYLSFPCFDDTANSANIKSMISTGDYAFADYAIVHWLDHLGFVLVNKGYDKEDELALKECVDDFLSSRSRHHSDVDWAPDPIKSSIQDLQREEMRKDIFQRLYNRETQPAEVVEQSPEAEDQDSQNQIDLGLDKTLLRVRSILYDLYNDPAYKVDLEEMYGKTLFKCSRPDCESFFEGFKSIQNLRDHEADHDRLCCRFDGCIATFAGKLRRRRYLKHVKTTHMQQDEDGFPETLGQSFIGALKEAVEDRDQETVKSMILAGWRHSNPGKTDSTSSDSEDMRLLFASERSSGFKHQTLGWSKKLWEQALKDPDEDMIRCLTNLTMFEGTNAQAFIVEHATNSDRRELVKHFTAGDYYRGKGGKCKIPWDRAIEVAIKRDDGEMLGILVGAALKNPTIGLKSFDDEKLRQFCIRASRIGALSCVKYFIDEHLVDPFISTSRSLDPGALDSLLHKRRFKRNKESVKLAKVEKLWDRRSVLFQAVTMGHQHVVGYLQPFRVGSGFATPNSCEKLIQVAVVNSHESVLEMLAEAEGLDDVVLKKYKALSRLHNAIRTGKEQYAKLLIQNIDPLDFPDRNYCTPIIYAASHGMEDVVRHLILKDANVDQSGMLEFGLHSGDLIPVVRAEDVAEGSIHDLLLEVPAVGTSKSATKKRR